MKELTRNELAIVKRTAKSTKQLRDKRDRIVAKQQELEAQLISINNQIDMFEQPIKHLTGGFTSEEVLNGTMVMAEAIKETQVEVDGQPTLKEKEVPAEEAVAIDPNVQSPLEEETPWNPEDAGECGTNTNEAPFMND